MALILDNPVPNLVQASRNRIISNKLTQSRIAGICWGEGARRFCPILTTTINPLIVSHRRKDFFFSSWQDDEDMHV